MRLHHTHSKVWAPPQRLHPSWGNTTPRGRCGRHLKECPTQSFEKWSYSTPTVTCGRHLKDCTTQLFEKWGYFTAEFTPTVSCGREVQQSPHIWFTGRPCLSWFRSWWFSYRTPAKTRDWHQGVRQRLSIVFDKIVHRLISSVQT